MIKGRLDQLFVLEPADTSAAPSKQLRVPTLEERVRLYLRAVYGEREVTREEYLRARNLILDAMATHLKENSLGGLANKPAGVVDVAPGIKPIRLPDETLRAHETHAPRRKRTFDLGSRLSEFLSSLTPRTLAWSATAAAVVILVPAAVIIKVWNEIEQGPPSAQQTAEAPGSSVQSPPLASLETKADPHGIGSAGGENIMPRARGVPPRAAVPGPDVAVQSKPRVAAEVPPVVASTAPTPKLSDEEIAALVAQGRQLIVAGDIPKARLVLQQAAEAGNATAALELGATYDPIELGKLDARDATLASKPVVSVRNIERKALPDIAMARTWYQKAKDLGSTEALGRLENLAGRDRPKR